MILSGDLIRVFRKENLVQGRCCRQAGYSSSHNQHCLLGGALLCIIICSSCLCMLGLTHLHLQDQEP